MGQATNSRVALTHQFALWWYRFFLLLGLCTIGLTAWAAALLWRLPYDGLNWSGDGVVLAVDPLSPAALAGAQPSDVLLEVNGQSHYHQQPPYYQFSAGNSIILRVLRENQPQVISYTLIAPSWLARTVRLEPLLIGLTFWVVSVAVWALRPFHNVTKLFFLASQVAMGMLVVGILSITGYAWISHVFNILLLLLAPLVLHFYATFPEQLHSRARRLLLWTGYIGALVLVCGPLVFPELVTHPGLRMSGRLFVALSLISALVLLLDHRDQMSLLNRRRRRLLIAGMLVSLSPLLFGSFLPHTLWGTPLLPYVGTFPFLILLPLSYAYAVRQGELGRIDLLLNRSLVYALLSVLILIINEVAFLLLHPVLTNSWIWPAINGGLVLLAAGLFGSLRVRLQQWVDRLFYEGWYDYRTVVQSMSAELSQVRDLEQLVERLMTVERTMRFSAAMFFWPQGDELVPKGGFAVDPSIQMLRLPLHGVLARYLRTNAHLRSRDQIISLLSSMSHSFVPAERSLLAEEQLRFWLPLVSRGELRGVLVMGDRQTEELVDQEDLDILATLSEQAAIAAENVALLEMLRTRLKQVEQMHADLAETQGRLAESREAERLHLARELHDGPIQDLYGVRFQLGALTDHIADQSGQERLATTLMLLEQVTGVLRATCSDLRPPTLTPFGLEMAIRSHATKFQEAHPEFQLELDLMHDGQTIPERDRLALFRIYQESLNNVVKHAQARWIFVLLELSPEQIVLEIRDDGQGFDVPLRWVDLARQGHFGLLGIAERVGSISGQLEVLSAPREGTVVRVTIARPAHGRALVSEPVPGRVITEQVPAL
jgi:signal transduction histidine kinase